MFVVLLGSILGFISAVTGLVFIELSFLAALGLWALSGPVSLVVALLIAGIQHEKPAEQPHLA